MRRLPEVFAGSEGPLWNDARSAGADDHVVPRKRTSTVRQRPVLSRRSVEAEL